MTISLRHTQSFTNGLLILAVEFLQKLNIVLYDNKFLLQHIKCTVYVYNFFLFFFCVYYFIYLLFYFIYFILLRKTVELCISKIPNFLSRGSVPVSIFHHWPFLSHLCHLLNISTGTNKRPDISELRQHLLFPPDSTA